jgi:hypothetical protein
LSLTLRQSDYLQSNTIPVMSSTTLLSVWSQDQIARLTAPTMSNIAVMRFHDLRIS